MNSNEFIPTEIYKKFESFEERFNDLLENYNKYSTEEKNKLVEESENIKNEILPFWKEYVYSINPIPTDEKLIEKASKALRTIKDRFLGEDWKPNSNNGINTSSNFYQMMALEQYKNLSKEELLQEKKLINILNFLSRNDRNDVAYYLKGRFDAIDQLLDYEKYLFGQKGKESYFKFKQYVQDLQDISPTKENHQWYLKEKMFFQNQSNFNKHIFGKILSGFEYDDGFHNLYSRIFLKVESGTLKEIQQYEAFTTIKKAEITIYWQRSDEIRKIVQQIQKEELERYQNTPTPEPTLLKNTQQLSFDFENSQSNDFSLIDSKIKSIQKTLSLRSSISQKEKALNELEILSQKALNPKQKEIVEKLKNQNIQKVRL